MDWHDECEEFCLNPLHPGPCKGQQGRRGGQMDRALEQLRGNRDANKPAPAKKATAPAPARKAAPVKAAPAKAAPSARGGSRVAPAGKQADAAASVMGMLGDAGGGRAGNSLGARIRAARTPEERDKVITEASLQMARVMANNQGHDMLTPDNRRKLARFLAPKINEAIRSGNTARLQELREKLGTVRNGDMAALGFAGEGAEEFTEAAQTSGGRWRGMLAPIGKPTGDGRMFAPNALTNRDLPLPLRFQRQDGGGHGGAVVVGRILKITYSEDQAYAEGDWLNPEITPEVNEAKEWTRQKVIGPSVDLDDAVMEMTPAPQADTQAAVDDDCGCELAADEKEPAEPKMIRLVTQGRISGATLVQIPAFAECAALELSDDSDWDTEESVLASGLPEFAAGDPVAIAGEDDDDDDVGYYVLTSEDQQWVTVVRDSGDVDVIHASRIEPAGYLDARAWDDALVASAASAPPTAWFADPALDGPTPLTVTEDGRVFGHLANWRTCHVGLPGCTTAPRSQHGYAFFHTGEVITSEGESISVGKITLGTGHADPQAGFRAAADHYDNSGSCVAVVRAGDDTHGIWLAGALIDGCDETRLAELRRSPLSGDWRRIGSHLELVAALAVNVPGFPVPRSRVAAGRPMSLVAAGVVTEEFHGTHNQQDHAGKFTPRPGLINRDGIGGKKSLPVPNRTADASGHGAFWRKDRNGMSAEEVFAEMFKRRKRIRQMQYELDVAHGEALENRWERAAALLAVIEMERG